MTTWSSVKDVYGPATEVPDLLATAEADGDESATWQDLWSRLCHQGTVAEASYAALPLLLEMARRHPGGAYMAPLHLASGIVASTDGPRDRADVRRDNAETIAALGAIAVENLANAESDADFVYGLQFVAAFEDLGPWQRELESLVDGELQGECPECGEYLRLALDESFILTSGEDDSCQPTTVEPASNAGDPVEQRLLDLAGSHGRPTVTEQLRHVFGRATCPCCGHGFEVPAFLD
ncbi:hypothetical protein BCF74_1201 [Knoellia remsis]|uniref:Uncharacterized protein n=1 Tax=Knoellia remsis TaxID=407159 RepID=A0A2T0UDU2_9MICO|nr:hypothetical protein [Knoellia remsis]PRY56054.1 hypothetical protein BCF74_1201 [Knoellia remsis]